MSYYFQAPLNKPQSEIIFESIVSTWSLRLLLLDKSLFIDRETRWRKLHLRNIY